jgi:hypothetical protein
MARWNFLNSAVCAPDFRALVLPFGAPPLGLILAAWASLILPRPLGRWVGATAPSRRGERVQTPPSASRRFACSAPPPQAGEDNDVKPLIRLEKQSEVVLRILRGGASPSSGKDGNFGKPRRSGRETGPPRACSRSAMVCALATTASQSRTNTPIQADFSFGSLAKTTRFRHASFSSDCACRYCCRAHKTLSLSIKIF